MGEVGSPTESFGMQDQTTMLSLANTFKFSSNRLEEENDPHNYGSLFAVLEWSDYGSREKAWLDCPIDIARSISTLKGVYMPLAGAR